MGSTYEIHFRGTLDVELSAWLDGPTQVVQAQMGDSSITCLTCNVPDQAALRGVLNRLWDLNLALISVRQIDPVLDKENDHVC